MNRIAPTKWGRTALAAVLCASLTLQAPCYAFATGEGETQEQTQTQEQDKEQQANQDEAQKQEDQKKRKEQFQQQKAELEQQMEVARNTLASLNSEAELAEYELITVTAQLDATNAHIAELDEKIPQTQMQLETSRSELAELISDSYKAGTPTLLDVFLDVTSFDDVVSRVEYANKISEYKGNVITEVKDLNSKLVQERSDLELERVQQEKLVEDQRQRLAAVEAAAASTAQYYNALSVELQDMIVAEEEADRAAAEQSAQGAAAEAMRLAEEMDGEQIQESGEQVGGTTQGTNAPAVAPIRENLPVRPTTSVYSFVARAFSIIGAGYQWSGYTWDGSIRSSAFTCSGVIDFARGRASRSSSPEILYAEVGSRLKTDKNTLSYGDLVFYNYGGRHPGHVGIYIGGGSIIDSIPNGGVAIRNIDYMDFIGGGPIY